MDRLVRVRRRSKPPLLAVYHGVMSDDIDLDKVEPNYYFTRIWIGVAPPEDVDGEPVPGYACVVGEVYDGDPMQRDRNKIVLDEGIALDPDDFSAKERLYHGMRGDALQHPTLYSLRDAVIALKDLYWADVVVVPPGNPRFLAFFQNTDGLVSYDGRYGDSRYHRIMPFFVSRRRIANGVVQADHEERAHNMQLVNSLLSMDRLQIMTDCDLFWERRLHTAYRAIGLVCSEMQLADMTYQIRQMRFSDGYDEREPTDEELDRRSGVRNEVEDLVWWAGGADRLGEGRWLA